MKYLGITKHLNNNNVPIQSAWFEYLGGLYKGRGFLEYIPERGFTINALLDRTGPPLPNPIEFPMLRIARPDELRRIRMRVLDSYALSSPVCVGDRLGLLLGPSLSTVCPSMLFITDRPSEGMRHGTYGSALLSVSSNMHFPQVVERETRFSGRTITLRSSLDGLQWNTDGMVLQAIREDSTCLEVHWQLTGDEWTKEDNWKLGPALANALSILGGCTVQVIQRMALRRNKDLIEWNHPRSTDHLSYLTMAPPSPLGDGNIDAELCRILTYFFLKGGRNADVARQMLDQMAEAAQQRTRAGRELLCATILEAALRTVFSIPFSNKKPATFNVEKELSRFRDTYLTTSWTPVCKDVIKRFRRLRHRNAHPDWMTQEGGGMSSEALEDSLDDMIRLARFYGYMILAMAGVEGLIPRFPKPIRDQGASIVFGAEE